MGIRNFLTKTKTKHEVIIRHGLRNFLCTLEFSTLSHGEDEDDTSC